MDNKEYLIEISFLRYSKFLTSLGITKFYYGEGETSYYDGVKFNGNDYFIHENDPYDLVFSHNNEIYQIIKYEKINNNILEFLPKNMVNELNEYKQYLKLKKKFI